jgi:hypothetical protein
MREPMIATTAAMTVGRNKAIAKAPEGAGRYPSAIPTRSPIGSMSAVASVARTVLPRVDGTRSGNAMMRTATDENPFGRTPVGSGTEWYAAASRKPTSTS